MKSKYTPEEIREMMYGLDTPVIGDKPAINLDNAATTPPFKAVIEEINEKLCWYGSIGRGVGHKSSYSSEVYEKGREIVKEFVGINRKSEEFKDYSVIYINHTTEGMNKLASALIEHECRKFSVITTRMEHHANDLPWRERLGADRILFADVDEKGRLKIGDIERLLQENKDVKYVTVTAASNVTGYVNDVHRIAAIVHKNGARIIVDGAQLVAHREFNILRNPKSMSTDPEAKIDFFLFSAHKMYSPFGGGAIIGLNEVLDKHIPCSYGGAMVKSVYDYNIDYSLSPDLYETGSPNYPGVVGMLKAMEILKDIGFDYIQDHEQRLMKKTIDELKKIPGVRLYGDNDDYSDRVGILVFNIDRRLDSNVAQLLADQSAIAVRHAKFCSHPYVARLLGKTGFSSSLEVDNSCLQNG
ncbi:MAG: aminotransferase class V-fold PLP-dependent enzyme, partial [Bacteroidales bacterium]|nr:aminotransferase class V-fold PLP-dependent enzyme [Bacteroidales bacterium]